MANASQDNYGKMPALACGRAGILQKCFCEPLRLGVFAGAFLFYFCRFPKVSSIGRGCLLHKFVNNAG